jgi:hypothetical protein
MSEPYIMHFRETDLFNTNVVLRLFGLDAVTVAAFKTDREMVVGIAACSYQDQFCRRIGRDIASGRALKYIRERGLNVKDKPHTKEEGEYMKRMILDVVQSLPLTDGKNGRGSVVKSVNGRVVITPV